MNEKYRIAITDTLPANGYYYSTCIKGFFDDRDQAIELAEKLADKKNETLDCSVAYKVQMGDNNFVIMNGDIDVYSASVWPVCFDGTRVIYRESEIKPTKSGLVVSYNGAKFAECNDIADACMFVDSLILSCTVQRIIAERSANGDS